MLVLCPARPPVQAGGPCAWRRLRTALVVSSVRHDLGDVVTGAGSSRLRRASGGWSGGRGPKTRLWSAAAAAAWAPSPACAALTTTLPVSSSSRSKRRGRAVVRATPDASGAGEVVPVPSGSNPDVPPLPFLSRARVLCRPGRTARLLYRLP